MLSPGGAEGVAAHELGQVRGTVSRGIMLGLHFIECYRDLAPEELPRRFCACEPSTNDGYLLIP